MILVNNSKSDVPRGVLVEGQRQLPLVYIQEPIAGKSRALNRALDIVRGTLIIFTDDDILMSPVWISEFVRAAQSYAQAHIFCGPVLPLFPIDTPLWLRDHPFAGVSFGKFMPPFPEGPLPAEWTPSGGNFAVRASAVKGRRFRLDLGPSVHGNFMGEDTDFVQNLYHKPEQLVFLPAASVQHCIRPEATAIPVLQERAFNSGRSIMIMKAAPVIIGYKISDNGQPHVHAFEISILRNFYLGQLYQADAQNTLHAWQLLIDAIEQLGGSGAMSGICPVAAEWLNRRSAFLADFKQIPAD